MDTDERENYGYATYSAEDDKLRFYNSARLPDDVYERLKKFGLTQRAYTQGCFFGVWSPGREDLLVSLCGDIEEENSTIEERAEARAERFSTYSENAAARASQRGRAADQAVDGIPFGQPILVGHHSERRHRKALERCETNMRKAYEERKRSEYWETRARASQEYAERKVKPDVIYRRIKKLEAEKRKQEREFTRLEGLRQGEENERGDMEWRRDRYIREQLGKDYSTDYSDLTAEEQATCDAYLKVSAENTIKHVQRWIDHLTNRITYERTMLEAVGGLVADKKPLEVGGAVLCYGEWLKIIRVNKSGGNITSVSTEGHPKFWNKREVIPVDRIKEYKTKAEQAK